MWTLLLISMALLGEGTPPQPFVVIYHPDAKRAYNPNEPLWDGRPICGPEASPAGSGSRVKSRPPKRIDNTRPTYPSREEMQKWGPGTFLAEATISVTGRIKQVQVLRSNSEGFDAFALQDLAAQRYEPARLKGKPIEFCMVYTARPHP